MLCKITMYFFPILILLYAWWKRGRIFWGDLRKSILFFIVSLVVCVMYLHSAVIYLGATHFQAPGPIPLHGLLERFALAGLMLTFCFGRVFLPLHPMPFYPHWKLEPLGLWIALPWLGIILALVYCWNNRRGWGRPALFGVAFFGLGLAPFLGFFNSVYMCVTWVDDHFLYIPIIGLIALIIGGIEGIGRLISRGFLACAIVAGAASLILLAFQTRIYSTLFADQEKLWLYNLKYNPDAWIARTQLGQAYAQKHEYDKAIEQFQESVRINPDFYNSHLFLGIYLCYAGRLSEGASSFAEAVRLQPALPEARLYLAHALYQTGQVPEAMAQLNEIVRLQPNSLEARDGLSYGLEREGRLPDAIAEIQAALDYYPRNPKLLARMEELENAAQKRANPPVHGHAPPK